VFDAALNMMRAYTHDQSLDSKIKDLLGVSAGSDNGMGMSMGNGNTDAVSSSPSDTDNGVLYSGGAHTRASNHQSMLLDALGEERGVVPPVPPIFYGRDPELKRLRQWLGRNRSITIVADGGTGKTSLAVKLGTDLQEQSSRYPQGIWFVELGAGNSDLLAQAGAHNPAHDVNFVAQAVMQRLGLTEEPNQTVKDTLLAFLKRRTLLLIFDGCEQLAQACAYLTDAILGATENVQIIATSRVPLGATGEVIFQLAPLPVPKSDTVGISMTKQQWEAFQDQYQSVKLFAALSSGAWAETDAYRLGNICRRLGGVPLAIELAAKRVNPAVLVEDIGASHNRQYSLLRRGDYLDRLLRTYSGSGASPSVQQTLEATLDWAVSLLTDSEKSMLEQASIFAGSFSLRAAEQIVVSEEGGDSTFDHQAALTNLVNNALVSRRVEGSFIRYSMHDQVRSYAFRMLLKNYGNEQQTLKQVQGRYFEFYHSLVKQAERRLPSAERETWIARLDIEYENIRAALLWASGQSRVLQEQVLELAAPLSIFLFFKDRYTEGITLICDLKCRYTGNNSLALASSAFGLGVLYRARGYATEALTYLRESVSLYETVVADAGQTSRDNELRLAYSRLFLALTLRDVDAWASNSQDPSIEIEDQCKLVDAALQKFIHQEDEWGIALAYTFLGACKVALADRTERQSIRELELNDTGLGTDSLSVSNDEASLAAAARDHLRTAFERAGDLNDVWLLAQVVIQLGILGFTIGDYEEAVSRFKQFIRLRDRRLAPMGIGGYIDEKLRHTRSEGALASALVRQTIDEKRGLATSLRGIAAVLVRQFEQDQNRDRLLLAAWLLSVAGDVYRYLSAQVREYDPLKFAETEEKLNQYLLPEERERLAQDYQTMTMDQAIKLVQESPLL
jgi:predicted ATPase